MKASTLFGLFLLNIPFMLHAQWIEKAQGLLPINYGVFDVSVVNEDVVWGVAFQQNIGNNVPTDHITKVIKSTDSGESWEIYDVTNAIGRISFDIKAFDENTAFITTQDFGNGNGRGLFKTIDGGQSWVEIYNGNAGAVWIRFFSPMEGLIINRNIIAVTEDGGQNWQSIPQSAIPSFANDEYTLISSGNNSCQIIDNHVWFGTSKGRVYYSQDKGQYWNVANTTLGEDAFIFSVAFKDTLNGLCLAIDADNSLTAFNKTTDGGQSWEAINTVSNLFISNITHVTGTDSVFVGTSSSNVLPLFQSSVYSLDFGNTWQNIDNGTPFGGTQFISPSLGWSSRERVTNTGQAAMFKWDNDIFEPLTDLLESDVSSNFKVFPSPFSSTINVAINTLSLHQTHFNIYNNNGHILRSGQFFGSENQINLSTLNSGIYYIELRNEKQYFLKKIIKME